MLKNPPNQAGNFTIFQSCLLPKMRLSVVLEGRYTGYESQKVFYFDLNLPKKVPKLYWAPRINRVNAPDGDLAPFLEIWDKVKKYLSLSCLEAEGNFATDYVVVFSHIFINIKSLS